MIESTLLATLSTFLYAHKADIASKVIASASYDVLKNSLDFSVLKNKLAKFFKKDQDGEKFIETLCEQKMTTDVEVDEEVKKVYESISGATFDQEIVTTIKEWLSENKGAIQRLDVVTNSNNSGGFNIGSQNANNIYNVQGDFNPDKK
jgi:hypothetical protein